MAGHLSNRLGLITDFLTGCVRLWEPALGNTDEVQGAVIGRTDFDVGHFSIGNSQSGELPLVMCVPITCTLTCVSFFSPAAIPGVECTPTISRMQMAFKSKEADHQRIHFYARNLVARFRRQACSNRLSVSTFKLLVRFLWFEVGLCTDHSARTRHPHHCLDK